MAQNPFKQYEYMVCSCIALATRAAIRGGLDPTSAYAASDLLNQRLEKCRTIPDILRLQRDVMTGFAEQVRQARIKRSKISCVEKSKLYIENHLNIPFHLEDLAKEIGGNESYLSRRFSEETGMGIQKYTRIRRVEAAADLLKYSDKGIADIAFYLCFPSQSHFGAVFKSHFGLTPAKYRECNGVIEFH
jgi:AraC-like DNA-binding protein